MSIGRRKATLSKSPMRWGGPRRSTRKPRRRSMRSTAVLVTPTTVLEALNNAGGFRDFANKKKIRILRTTAQGMKEFRFDYNSVIKGKKIEDNILLKPGDQIIVP